MLWCYNFAFRGAAANDILDLNDALNTAEHKNGILNYDSAVKCDNCVDYNTARVI